MVGPCERMSERRSEWPSIMRVDFIVILPIVQPPHSHEVGPFERSLLAKKEVTFYQFRFLLLRVFSPFRVHPSELSLHEVYRAFLF